MTVCAKPRGFTLIELLIVVAIIAILAAIAVPNFMEAQMRAQISRVKADMRSVATALESYRIDTNLYPPTALFLDGEQVDFPNGFICGWGGVTLLTTPIAYISSYPADVFPDLQGWTFRQPKGVKGRPIYYDCWAQDPPGGSNESNSMFFSAARGRGIPERAMGLVWALFSSGPTVRRETPQSEGDAYGWYFYNPRDGFPSILNPYDPTNGTRSVGSIARYSAGEVNTYEGSSLMP